MTGKVGARPVRQRVTAAQIAALRWLHSNGGLAVPNMNMAGRSREWPQTRTIRALMTQGLVDFEQGKFEWSVRVNDAGLAIAQGLSR